MDMTLRKRFLLGYLIPLVLFVAVAVAVLFAAQNLRRTAAAVGDAQNIVINAADMFADYQMVHSAVRGYLLDPVKRKLELVRKARQDYVGDRSKLDGLVKDPAQRQMLLQIDRVYADLVILHDRELELMVAGKSQNAMELVRSGRGSDLAIEMDKTLDAFVAAERKILDQRLASQEQEVRWMVSLVIGATGAAILLSLIIGNIVANRVGRSIGEAISGLSSSTTQIAATIDEHERTVTQQAAAVNETTATVEELGISSRQSSDQAEATAAAARQAQEVAAVGSETAGQVALSMTDLQVKVRSIADQIASLSEQAGQIGGIARVVGELASETNMLALNAAVEAVRAGENGKGFAVVAAEVRKLAEQSKRSAERANALVDDIQRATNAAVMVAEEGNRLASDAAGKTNHTLDAFHEITRVVSGVSVSTQQVVLNSKQQAIALNQVTEAMKSLSAASAQIAAGTQQTRQGVQTLNDVALGLKAMI